MWGTAGERGVGCGGGAEGCGVGKHKKPGASRMQEKRNLAHFSPKGGKVY